MGRFKPASTPQEVAAREQARAAKLDALHGTLVSQIAALRAGQDWQGWLRVAARFHDYSLNNVLLIAAQRPQATAVAGFNTWKTLGRQVDKGEKGIQILAPMVTRTARTARSDEAAVPPPASTDSPTDRAGEDQPGRVAGFRVVHVFDVSQTSGEPLPEQPTPQLLRGQAPAGLWDALAEQITARGFTLHRGDCGPQVNGLTHYGQRTVTVRADVDDAQAAKTLAHELGHVLLHDPTDPVEGIAASPSGTDPTAVPLTAAVTSLAQCRGRFEVEAESVAFLVASAHGLDTGDYTFPYVAGWAASLDATTPDTVVRATAGRVLSAARLILAAAPTAAEQDAGAGQADRSAELSAACEQGASRTGALLSAALATEQDSTHRPGPVPDRLVHLHALAVEFYKGRLHAAGPEARRAVTLLASRGVDQAGALEAGVGYAPRAWTHLVDHLRQAGVDDTELLASGLAMTSSRGSLVDRFRDRIVFPVLAAPGRPVALLGRAVDPTATDPTGTPTPKYLNSPDSAIYRKGQLLYGLSEATAALAAGAKPVLVEGPMDAHAIGQAGPGFVGVAVCGTALTAAQIELLDTAVGGLAGRGVIVAFDGDQAGRQAALRAYDLLRPAGVWPHALHLPAGQDPAELLQQHGPAGLRAALLAAAASPLVDMLVDDRIDRHHDQLRWVEGQLTAARSAATVIATLPTEHIGRQVTRVATRLEMTPATVTGLVVDALAAARPAAEQPARAPRRVLTAPAPGPEPPAPAASSQPPRPVSAAQRARAAFPIAWPSPAPVAEPQGAVPSPVVLSAAPGLRAAGVPAAAVRPRG